MSKDLKKSIGVFFISFFTLGIADLIYVYIFSDKICTDIDGKIFLPMKEAVLFLITFGIYGIFWSFKAGERLDKKEGREYISSKTVACAILSLFIRSIAISILYYRIKSTEIGE